MPFPRGVRNTRPVLRCPVRPPVPDSVYALLCTYPPTPPPRAGRSPSLITATRRRSAPAPRPSRGGSRGRRGARAGVLTLVSSIAGRWAAAQCERHGRCLPMRHLPRRTSRHRHGSYVSYGRYSRASAIAVTLAYRGPRVGTTTSAVRRVHCGCLVGTDAVVALAVGPHKAQHTAISHLASRSYRSTRARPLFDTVCAPTRRRPGCSGCPCSSALSSRTAMPSRPAPIWGCRFGRIGPRGMRLWRFKSNGGKEAPLLPRSPTTPCGATVCAASDEQPATPRCVAACPRA